jgi:hypothetical protein
MIQDIIHNKSHVPPGSKHRYVPCLSNWNLPPANCCLSFSLETNSFFSSSYRLLWWWYSIIWMPYYSLYEYDMLALVCLFRSFSSSSIWQWLFGVACWRGISPGKYDIIPMNFIFCEKEAGDFECFAFLVLSEVFLTHSRYPRRLSRMTLLQMHFVLLASYTKDHMTTDFQMEKGSARYEMTHF